MKSLEKEYKKKKFYWGKRPWKELVKALNYAPKGIALDIGAGEGRNSIFLAKNGFRVLAIDKIPEGLEKLNDFSKKKNLSIETKVVNIKDFEFPDEQYSLVLSVASLDFLKFSTFKKIVQKIKKSLVSNGVIYFMLFSTKDPFLKKFKRLNFKEVEKNTFYLPKANCYRHFFEKEELRKVLKIFNMIKIKEMRYRDTGHGEPHFHSVMEVLAKK